MEPALLKEFRTQVDMRTRELNSPPIHFGVASRDRRAESRCASNRRETLVLISKLNRARRFDLDNSERLQRHLVSRKERPTRVVELFDQKTTTDDARPSHTAEPNECISGSATGEKVVDDDDAVAWVEVLSGNIEILRGRARRRLERGLERIRNTNL